MSGVLLDRAAFDSTSIFIRGPVGWCPPSLYLDGNFVPGISASEIDSWIPPARLAGLEVYSEATAPRQYRQPGSTRGSLLLWSR